MNVFELNRLKERYCHKLPFYVCYGIIITHRCALATKRVVLRPRLCVLADSTSTKLLGPSLKQICTYFNKTCMNRLLDSTIFFGIICFKCIK